jgi:DNA-binding response OmpR family regulator
MRSLPVSGWSRCDNFLVPFSSTNRRVLIYGLDPILLDTRRLILQHAGLSVEIAHGPEEFGQMTASRPYDLLVLCHTVPDEQRETISSTSSSQPVFEIPMLLAPEPFVQAVQQVLN